MNLLHRTPRGAWPHLNRALQSQQQPCLAGEEILPEVEGIQPSTVHIGACAAPRAVQQLSLIFTRP